MPTLTIDGQQITVDKGKTVIQAAEALGTYIPRYCYHPGLSIAGSCRMCLVEIEKMPKLQIACYTQATEGMVVHTNTDQVKVARQAILEFLLSNHPLDCPVCDQSGECDLQNFYMEFGLYQSKFLENKIKRRKAYPIGPHVILDNERCILCSRCVRFCKEVSKSYELGIVSRGEHSEIALFEDRELNNPYSGNVIDICPVGALTERDFRFQCRVWYLDRAKSICPGCARGCSIEIHYNVQRPYQSRGKRVLRIKPRFNPDVNKWWICDEGRYGFEFIDAPARLQKFLMGKGEQRIAVTADEALDTASLWIREAVGRHGADSIGIFLSPKLSNEDLYAIAKFARHMRISKIDFRNPAERPGFEDDFLIRGDKNPNTRGCAEMGLYRQDTSNGAWMAEEIQGGAIRMLLVFLQDLTLEPEFGEVLGSLEHLIFVGSNHNKTAETAALVLPSATYAEKDGSFTNFEGRAQRFDRAIAPLGDSLSERELMAKLGSRFEMDPVFFEREQLLSDLRAEFSFFDQPALDPPEVEVVYQRPIVPVEAPRVSRK
ncbi:MAG TPA: 2Fe-2S iron-sulfur cluster-binding protein [Acidobacteriota bacterium]|jgi:NADH-quinone oxidoreductase subunit G|nr:2Fe-2S iron-sulfur cluster-binding protein [Acidobacteriota bacterium]